MLLFDKIQELLNALEEQKETNNTILALCKSTLSEHLSAELEARMQELENTHNERIDSQISAQINQADIQGNIKAQVKKQLDLEALNAHITSEAIKALQLEELKNTVINIVNKHATEAIQEALNSEQLQEFLHTQRTNMQNEAVKQTTANLQAHATSEAVKLMPEIASECVKKLNFNFLANDEGFKGAAIEAVKPTLINTLESEHIRHYIQENAETIFTEKTSLETLKSAELKATAILQRLIEIDKVKIVREVELLLQRFDLARLRLENEAKLEHERRELIDNGELRDPKLLKKIYYTV